MGSLVSQSPVRSFQGEGGQSEAGSDYGPPGYSPHQLLPAATQTGMAIPQSLDQAGLNLAASNNRNLNPGDLNPGNLNPGNLNPGNPKPGNLNPGNPNPGNLNPGNLNLEAVSLKNLISARLKQMKVNPSDREQVRQGQMQSDQGQPQVGSQVGPQVGSQFGPQFGPQVGADTVPVMSLLSQSDPALNPIFLEARSSTLPGFPSNDVQLARKSPKMGLTGKDFMRTLEGIKRGVPNSDDLQSGEMKGLGLSMDAVDSAPALQWPTQSEDKRNYPIVSPLQHFQTETGSKNAAKDFWNDDRNAMKLQSMMQGTHGVSHSGNLNGLSGNFGHLDQQPNSLGKSIVEIPANVVPGAMSRDRLSTDSLIGLSTGIRNLTQQGSGEIRVRLKPGNLGELNIRVITDGNRVGLHIQASDEKAKAVIEESMVHLKESLSAQHMTLSQVDLTLASSPVLTGSDTHRDTNHGHSGFQEFNAFQDNLGQNSQSESAARTI